MPELYNLAADVAEQRDLFRQQPDVVRRMRQSLEQLIARGSSRASPGAGQRHTGAVRYNTEPALEPDAR